MTAQTIGDRPVAVAPSFGRFAGLAALVRKDVTEWRRGRRAPIVFAIVTAFAVLTAANSWIVSTIAASLPPDVAPPELPASMAPLDNLLAAVGSQIFVLAAIFAVASLLVRERESGTLAWVASKPVSRGSIWLAKWISAGAILAVAAVIAPIAVTALAVVPLYGVFDPVPVLVVTGGAVASVVFYAALGLAAGTVVPGQPAIVAVGFGVFALAPMLAGLIPLPIEPFLPTSILGWSAAVATGADVPWFTPIAWAAWTGLLVVFALRRIERIEL